MRSLAFEKYEGLGNDFVVVDAADEAEVSPDLARELCDRRRGVGADGVLLLLPAQTAGADGRMRVINADGSIPEMCGNGLRCAAVHLAKRHRTEARELAIDTDAGLRRCAIDAEGLVTADMGVVRALEDIVVDVDGERIALTLADAGNPHAIALREVSAADFERLGPRLATHPRFERGTNVEFVVERDGGLDVLVWERGVGPTLACGTGACAVAAVAIAKGIVPEGTEVRVRLPGGELAIAHDPATGRTTMRGPARHVFSGSTPRGR